jgi:hypothetical protein
MEQRNTYRRNRRQQKTCCPKNKQAKLRVPKDKETGNWIKPGAQRRSWYPPSLVFSALVLFRSRSLPVSFSSGLALSQSGSLPR